MQDGSHCDILFESSEDKDTDTDSDAETANTVSVYQFLTSSVCVSLNLANCYSYEMQNFLEIFEETEETDEVVMHMVQNNPQSEEESPTLCVPHPQLPQEELRTFAILLLTLKKSYNLSESCIKAILLLMVLLIKVFMRFLKQSTLDNMDTVASSFLDLFPTSEHALRRLAGIDDTDCKFNQSVCCPKCFKTYPELRTWTTYSHSTPGDFLCDFVEYPRHPHVSRRMKCGSHLLKYVSSVTPNFCVQSKFSQTIA